MEKFDPLSEQERISAIVNFIETGYYSLAITLTTGDVLFGDQDFDLGFQYLPYSKKYRESEDKKPLKMSEKPISDHIVLLFPDGSGTVHGHSYGVWIPVSWIAHIQGIVLLVKEGPERALRNSSNPLSKSIKEHNFEIIERLDLKWRDYIEEALSKEAIPGGGIIFDRFELIYADWEYFKTRNGGIKSIGFSFVIGGSIGWEQSLYKFMMEKLHREKYTNLLLEGHPEYNTEMKVRGIIREDSEKQDSYLEGVTGCVYELRISREDTNSARYESIPVLIQDRSLCYPREYLNHIESELTVYGVLQQIPIRLNERTYNFCLLARAIAFIPPD
ncbi:hypothetical protein C5S31_05500 [ANME-1 cluster archaeon GoMg2]|nr:hypothetical protein [ANME-1 cluster archaeon GoMg2]